MKIKDLSATVLLAISGALAIVLVVLVLFTQPETVNAIAVQIGLQTQPMGVTIEDSPDRDDYASRTIKKPFPHGSRSGLTRGQDVSFEEPSPAHGQSLILQASSGVYKTEPAKSRRKTSTIEGPAVKATSIEQGHLIEKYMYLDGGIMIFVDGHILHTPSEPLAKR